MQLNALISSLPEKTGALHTLENGRPVRRSYLSLYQDVCAAQTQLKEWGIAKGSRVGIYAPNSYRWVVYDLALMAIGAISVPFTDDFNGAVDHHLIERYKLGLLLISKSHARLFPGRPGHVALIDADNNAVQALKRGASGDLDQDDQLSLVFSSGSAGGLKGLVISRKGVASTLPPREALQQARRQNVAVSPAIEFPATLLVLLSLVVRFRRDPDGTHAPLSGDRSANSKYLACAACFLSDDLCRVYEVRALEARTLVRPWCGHQSHSCSILETKCRSTRLS